MPTPPHSLGPQRRIVECLSYSTPFPRSATEDGRAEDGPSSSAQGRGATLLAGPEPPTPSLRGLLVRALRMLKLPVPPYTG